MINMMTPREVAERIAKERGWTQESDAVTRRARARRRIVELERDLAEKNLMHAFDDLGAELPARESVFKHVRVGQQHDTKHRQGY
jgi:hypothetical protein